MGLTTARYFTPSGHSIQAKGIEPDIEVLQEAPADPKARPDIEGEASLRGHLKAEGKEESGSQSYVPADEKDDRASRRRWTSYAALLPMPHFRPIQKPLFPIRLLTKNPSITLTASPASSVPRACSDCFIRMPGTLAMPPPRKSAGKLKVVWIV